jgi:5-methylcytosine-specific restriction endonuclease McrA
MADVTDRSFQVDTRVLRDSRRWFSDGSRQKAEARRSRQCVECAKPLPTSRTPYCGRRCQWQFRGRFFWDSARTFVLFRDRYTCQVCRTRCRARELDVDHIREIAAGGPNLDYRNLQAICRPCHRRKTSAFLRARGNRLADGAGSTRAPVRSSSEYWLEWFPA